MIIRSRLLLPVSKPALEDGALWVVDGRIHEIGPWRELKRFANGPVLDLGDSLVAPGWVNAHCHLDYTDMIGQLPPPRSFPDWIKSILVAKGSWELEDFHRSWQKGFRQLLESGTTTVANIETLPEVMALGRKLCPLRLYSYLEITGIRSPKPDTEILHQALKTLQAMDTGRGGLGLSPHAPYSTRASLLTTVARSLPQHPYPITIHVSESREEFDMFMYRRGALHDWLQNQRDMRDCGLGSPIQHLEKHGLLTNRTLAVHVNYLWDNDAERLARHGTGVVHCPRSHAYFQHQRFPRRELVRAGVAIGLGTDSLASVRGNVQMGTVLSLFEECQTLLRRDSTLTPEQVLRMGTMDSAAVLGLEGQVGQLAPDAWADLAVVPYTGNAQDAAEAWVHHTGTVTTTLIGGEIVWNREGNGGPSASPDDPGEMVQPEIPSNP